MMAIRSVLIAAGILLFFALFGEDLLRLWGSAWLPSESLEESCCS
jgi:small neutral amino acid transporter SnatA (MarC family)